MYCKRCRGLTFDHEIRPTGRKNICTVKGRGNFVSQFKILQIFRVIFLKSHKLKYLCDLRACTTFNTLVEHELLFTPCTRFAELIDCVTLVIDCVVTIIAVIVTLSINSSFLTFPFSPSFSASPGRQMTNSVEKVRQNISQKRVRPPSAKSRGPCSKAREQDSRTVVQLCIWFKGEQSQFSMVPNSTQSNMFHHGETTYRVGWMSENPTLVL